MEEKTTLLSPTAFPRFPKLATSKRDCVRKAISLGRRNSPALEDIFFKAYPLRLQEQEIQALNNRLKERDRKEILALIGQVGENQDFMKKLCAGRSSKACLAQVLNHPRIHYTERELRDLPQEIHEALVEKQMRVLAADDLLSELGKFRTELDEKSRARFQACIDRIDSAQQSMPAFDPKLCYNDRDYLSQEDWGSEDAPAAENVVILFPHSGGHGGQKGFCYGRADLLQALQATRVFHWTGKDEHTVCCPDPAIPYFKLPYPAVYIDWNGFRTLAEDGPPRRHYLLKKIGQDRVGTEFSASSLHGHLEDIYTIETLDGPWAETSKETKLSPQRICETKINPLRSLLELMKEATGDWETRFLLPDEKMPRLRKARGSIDLRRDVRQHVHVKRHIVLSEASVDEMIHFLQLACQNGEKGATLHLASGSKIAVPSEKEEIPVRVQFVHPVSKKPLGEPILMQLKKDVLSLALTLK